jgi:hypothetical protein
MKTVIIGQTQSGKSALLAGLHVAALHDGFTGRPWWLNMFKGMLGGNRAQTTRRLNGLEVRCLKTNEPFQRLSAEFTRIFETGFIGANATDEVCLYQLNLSVRRSWLPWTIIGRRRVPAWCGISSPVEMPDGPGEALFGDVTEASERQIMRDDLLDHLRSATGVILCVPPPPSVGQEFASNEVGSATPRFFRDFHQVLSAISNTGQPLPWRYLAVTLTKADRVFYSRGNEALANVQSNSTPERLRAWMAECSFHEALLNQIRIATDDRVRIAAGWSSIYGFTEEGTANFNPGTDGLLISPPAYRPAEVEGNWCPYQILDPFLFAAAGYTMADRATGRPGFVRLV